MTTQGPKTQWVMTYVMVGGDRIRTSTRAGGMEPTTQTEMTNGVVAVLADAARRGPLPSFYVQDMDRGGLPTLVMLGGLSHVELAPDPEPEGEAQRHLELVLTDPARSVPPPTAEEAPEPLADDSPTGVLPRLAGLARWGEEVREGAKPGLSLGPPELGTIRDLQRYRQD